MDKCGIMVDIGEFMPSSGWGCGPEIAKEMLALFNSCVERADYEHMRAEWLGCFISAIEQKSSFEKACWAGIEERDL
jgi:hypothetical protein